MAENITIKDIARICGVGIGTVSRAINNDPRVSEKTREKILRAVKEHHYVPNNSARNLKMTESNTIGLLFSGIDNPFFQGMISIFENACDKLGYAFFLYAVRENDRVENVAMEVCKERRLKGLIIMGGQLSFPNRRLDSLGIPGKNFPVPRSRSMTRRKAAGLSATFASRDTAGSPSWPAGPANRPMESECCDWRATGGRWRTMASSSIPRSWPI